MNNAPPPNRIQPPLIPMRPLPPDNPASQRHAAAFAEIRAIEESHASLLIENTELKRRVDALRNKEDLLQTALDDERQNSRIYQRKLIRLAASMSGIHALTAEAAKIMVDVKEVEEAAAEVAAEVAARTPGEGGA